MNHRPFTVNLTTGQAMFIQSKLPNRYCLITNSLEQRKDHRQICITKINQKYFYKFLNTIEIKAQTSLRNYQLIQEHKNEESQKKQNHTKFQTKQNIETSLNLEEELYLKSPRFFSEEQRQVYVIFHLLQNHQCFQECQQEIAKVLNPSTTAPTLDQISNKVIEGPFKYTVYHFWIEMREYFAKLREYFSNQIKFQLHPTILENYFNEIFNKKVLGQQRSVLNTFQSSKKKNNPNQNESLPKKLLSEQELKNLEDSLFRLPQSILEQVWELIYDNMPQDKQNEMMFNLKDLPNGLQKKLIKLVNQYNGKKRHRTDSISSDQIQIRNSGDEINETDSSSVDQIESSIKKCY